MSIKTLLAVTTFILASAATAPAFAHAKLQSSYPQAGSTLGGTPRQVRLKFNEALEPAFSKLQLTGPSNQEIPVTAVTVDKADPATMTAQMPQLATGEYHIRWTAMTHDGHKTRGEVAFTVK